MTGSISDVAAFGFFSVLTICITICVLDARRRCGKTVETTNLEEKDQ